MEKQIEAMTNDIGEKQEAGWKFLNDGFTTDVFNDEVAEHLVAKGWRKQEWHDVATDPPKTSGSYIVCTDKGGVCTAHYYADCGRFNAPFKKSAVWWTYLPEAPQKGE